MSDWTEAPELRRRLTSGREYRDTKNVPVGEESYAIPYRLLEAEEQLKLQARIDMASLAEAANENDDGAEEIVQEAEKTVQELQDKDELTSEEEDQLRDAQTTLVQNKGELLDALGEDTLIAFHDAGRWAISPDETDVANVMESTTSQQKSRFADIDGAPTPESGSVFTKEDARTALEAEMKAILDSSPFLIYFTLGQSVWEESRSAGKLLDGSDEEP